MAKATVESCGSIDIRQWNRMKLDGTFTYKWCVGEHANCISVDTLMGRIVLRYRVRELDGNLEKIEKIEDTIWLDETTSLGRKRMWFLCPECGQRVAILYAGSKYFRCRRCLGLVYESQHQSPSQRAISRVQKNRVKLGGSCNLYTPFPARPRYMRRERYYRMMEEEKKMWLESTQRREQKTKLFLKSIKLTEEQRRILAESIMRTKVSFAAVEKKLAERAVIESAGNLPERQLKP